MTNEELTTAERQELNEFRKGRRVRAEYLRGVTQYELSKPGERIGTIYIKNECPLRDAILKLLANYSPNSCGAKEL